MTKVMHEFGHGLTCKHFGGECHEMGVMILVLTPCLYCNVSDSWMLPNKWHRAAIGAAGMYVELVLASICTFIWWFSEPGLLQPPLPERDVRLLGEHGDLQRQPAAALRRLLHPGRPDGDPQPAAEGHARSSAASWASGAWAWKSRRIRSCPQRNQMFFALYSVAAAIYRWVVVFSILWFLYKVFEPYGLKVIGQMLGHGVDRGPGRACRCTRWASSSTCPGGSKK